MLNDEAVRLSALNIDQSFIVQAPAGSGKTELLTQRFLKLLAVVRNPEEIIAITFTRKAAAQMRQRILNALKQAHDTVPPQETHKQLTFKLAQQALQTDHTYQWNLLDNPNRLRLLTVDALSGFLSAQIPILAGFGSKPDITDQPQPLYEEAARDVISCITQDHPWTQPMETLLLHLDNHVEHVVHLLCALLAKREQWLPHIIKYLGCTDLLHEHLEEGLFNIVTESIEKVNQAFSLHLDELLALIQHGAHTLAAAGVSHHPFQYLCDLEAFTVDASQLSYWKALPALLLTQEGEFRKKIDKRLGFLPKTKEKEKLSALLETFSENERLRDILIDLQYCPDIRYPASQKVMIDALMQLLPVLYAQLRLTFQKHNVIDFVELNLAALRALGEEEEPTDLALYLDYQIHHLLIDEFQDTSITQYSLLEKLTRGWEPDDGRSLFLVGDPMQSIYRFREAEVGLFIRAQTQKINTLSLTPLTLQNNYRSDKQIIDWINHAFEPIFPHYADISEGAVPYTASTPTQNYGSLGVHSHGLVHASLTQEAVTVVQIIHRLQREHPNESIALLIRSRNQLREIVSHLHAEQLSFQAVDLETLVECPEIQDLLTLTRVVLHREDRIAWYALLRSPICGLTLADLHTLSQLATQQSIWQTIQNKPALSHDGQQRLQRIHDILSVYFREQGRQPFELALKGLWLALGFQEWLSVPQQKNASRFFKLIAEKSEAPKPISIVDLTQQLSKTYIEPQQTTSNLSIMTIHKSKGLEFDHVILPGLNARPAVDQHRLLLWLERPNQLGSIDFILAPIKQAHTDHDDIYRYLQRNEQRKLQLETARLLYVATTRAKKSLHLTACLATNTKNEIQFSPGSFAELLKTEFLKNLHYNEDDAATQENRITPTLQRAPSSWQSAYAISFHTPIPTANPLAQWDHSMKRTVGTVIHTLLAHEAKRSVAYAQRALQQAGLSRSQIKPALTLIEILLTNIQSDPYAKWIFNPAHHDAHNEYPITAVINGKIRHLIIDRSFVDQGVRWIIDYKTAIPSTDDLSTFIQEQADSYRQQLETYATALRGVESRPIQMGLYFPISCIWIPMNN